MAEIDAMIAETRQWRTIHAIAYRQGQPGRQIDAAACAIRERALLEAKIAILAERDRRPTLRELGWKGSCLAGS